VHERPEPAITRVLVIDDHPIFLEGIREMLSESGGIRVIGQAATASQGLSELKMKRPDVVLLDLDLPDASGVEVAERIAAESPSTIVLVISAFAQEENVAEALRAGARGYISKAADPRTLADAIRTAMNGGTVVASGLEPATWRARERLTLRELGILKQIALGKTNSEIGRELHLADKTVERVVATITAKLGAKNRAHAVARGIAQRLLDGRDL
jgi:DNA-binding NarL/FixJ family response regulator